MKEHTARLCAMALMAVGLTACAAPRQSSPAAETPVPASSQSEEPVTLTVYLESVYTEEGTHYPIYEKLRAFDDAHPGIRLEYVSPVGGATDPAARETQIQQINTEIITGGGPDVFLMATLRFTDSNLFPDIQKAMQNDSFLDLSEYAGTNGFDGGSCYPAILEAGQREGHQYILPLSFSVPLFAAAEPVVERLGFQADAAAADQPAFFGELSRVLQENGSQVAYSLSLTNLLEQPLMDYTQGTVQLDTEPVRQALTIEKEYIANQLHFFDNYSPDQVDALAEGTPAGVVEMSDLALGTLHSLEGKGVPVFLQGIPNESGGITAEITSYAMAGANTEHPEQCAELLYYLLSAECQDVAAYPCTTEELPVRRDSMQSSLEKEHAFLIDDASRETLTDEDRALRQEAYGGNLQDSTIDKLRAVCDGVTAAHFHTIWYNALQLGQDESGDDVLTGAMNSYLYGDTSLDDLIRTLTPRLQMYLDE